MRGRGVWANKNCLFVFSAPAPCYTCYASKIHLNNYICNQAGVDRRVFSDSLSFKHSGGNKYGS